MVAQGVRKGRKEVVLVVVVGCFGDGVTNLSSQTDDSPLSSHSADDQSK